MGEGVGRHRVARKAGEEDIAGKFLVPIRCPVRIIQANGDPVGGGAQEVELRVTFREKVQPNDDEELVWRVTGLFHEADMECEMSLAYPCWCKHKLAVVPSDHALRVGSTKRLIAGWEEGDPGLTPRTSGVPIVRYVS